MIKRFLVHIPSERPVRSVVDGAISLAISHGAHLDAVSVGYETMSPGVALAGGAAVASITEFEQERALARANAALAVFEAEARNAGINYRCQALASVPFEAAPSLSAIARLRDLTIVSQPESQRATTYDNVMPQEVLFESGGPVLFVPYTHKGPLTAKRIGIAWNGSRVAARALRDAAPFLASAEAITIIGVNEDRRAPAEPSVSDVSAYLARYGVTIRIERIDADRGYIQPTILSIAADHSLDLLVMGGYGHSRLQERFLGGVTRDMLHSMTVPTLMSH